MAKRRTKSLLEKLEEARSLCFVFCDCDGRGCGLCSDIAGAIEEAIKQLREVGRNGDG